jgi:nicotinate-nucleotide adenylyltransferase
VAAEAVRDELGVDMVLFIPSGRPPHKKSNLLYNEHRYIMTVLASATNPYFSVSRMEIDRPGMTYTIDTIRELKKLCKPDCRIYFITGADAIEEIMTWHEPEKLLGMCEFVAVTRPGYNKKKLLESVGDLIKNHNGSLQFLEVPALSISSTDIRNRVLAGKTIKYLVPFEVENYIAKYGLYSEPKNEFADEDSINQNLLDGMTVDMINKKLHYLLTPKRFTHTQGVASEASKLAEKYGANKEKAYLAGLLHDNAKCFGAEEKLDLCEKFGVELDDILVNQPDLTHSFLGAEIAKSDFGVTDEDVLNAIKYHTTGRKNMSLLEKIVYIADVIEPNRSFFDGLEETRRLAYSNIDKAMLYSLKHTVDFNKNKKRLIHPLSLEALEYFKDI